MLNIPLQSALIIYLICHGLGLLVVLNFYWLAKPFFKTITFFIIFYAFQSIGTILIYFRESLPLFLSINIANAFVMLASISFVFGIVTLTTRRYNKYMFTMIFAIHAILYYYFTFVTFNTNIRIITNSVLVLICYIYSIYTMHKWNQKSLHDFRLMSIVLYLSSLIMAYRGTIIFFVDDYGNDFLNYSQGSLGIILYSIVNIFFIVGLLSIFNSIMEKDLEESERSKSSLLSNLPGFAYRCKNDKYWTMQYLSEGFKQTTGYNLSDMLNNKVISYEETVCPEYRKYVRDEWNKSISDNKPCVIEYKIFKKNGDSIWIWEQGKGIYENGECTHIEGYIVDITSRKELEENLKHLSYRDSLTGLYNRRFIEDQLLRLNKSRNLPISIIMADVNGLKFINDSFGHSKGDEVIKIIANVMNQSLRGYELISRLSGDEFLIILENTTFEQAELICDRIKKNIKAYKTDIPISISLGYASKEEYDENLSEISKKAETMMYQVKIYEKPTQLRKAIDAVMKTLFEKDKLSETHSRNVSKLSRDLATAAGLNDVDISMIETAGLLHDVGKIIIDEKILRTKGKLTKEQYDTIKQHPEVGFRILSSVPELIHIAEVVSNHHERPDGLGYPKGKKDKNIPYSSKIISICDAYEAMTSFRPYRKALSKEDAIKELINNSGTQFDKNLVDIFVKMIKSSD